MGNLAGGEPVPDFRSPVVLNRVARKKSGSPVAGRAVFVFQRGALLADAADAAVTASAAVAAGRRGGGRLGSAQRTEQTDDGQRGRQDIFLHVDITSFLVSDDPPEKWFPVVRKRAASRRGRNAVADLGQGTRKIAAGRVRRESEEESASRKSGGYCRFPAGINRLDRRGVAGMATSGHGRGEGA